MILVVSILFNSIPITAFAQENITSGSDTFTATNESASDESGNTLNNGANMGAETEGETPNNGGDVVDPESENPDTGGDLVDPELEKPGTGGDLVDPELEQPDTGGDLVDPESEKPDTDSDLEEPEEEVTEDNLEETLGAEGEAKDEEVKENLESRIVELLQGVDVRSLSGVQAAEDQIDLLAGEYNALSEEERAAISTDCRELLDSFIHALAHIREIGHFDCMDENCTLHYPSGWGADGDDNVTPLTLEDFGINTMARASSRSVSTGMTYVINEDNENNTYTGTADNDLDRLIYNNNSRHPIEVRFDIDKLPVQSLYIAVKAFDVDEEDQEIDTVYVNGEEVGQLSGNNGTWNTTLLKLPLNTLKKGENYVSITVSDGWCVEIDWLQIIVDGGSHDTNIQNYSLTIQDSWQSENNIVFSVLTSIKQSVETEYYTEYILLNGTGSNLDSKFGTASSTEIIDLSMPKTSTNGTYRILGILKDGNEVIKAQDSISFEYKDGIAYIDTDTRITHNLSPAVLTNKSVAISVKAESVKLDNIKDITVWYGNENITDNPYTVSENGDYQFKIRYTANNEAKEIPYLVTVDNIDKTRPSIQCDAIDVEEDDATLGQIKTTLGSRIKLNDDVSISPDSYTLDLTGVNPNIPGEYQVQITAIDTAGNEKIEYVSITVKAKPLKLVQSVPVRNNDAFDLLSTLENTGNIVIVESGFVWGISQYPTIEMNNGSAISSPAVTQKGGKISANTDKIVSGPTYYSRAYIKDDKGDLHYSNQATFAIDGKDYGTISVQYDTNGTFIINRTGGVDEKQTVYYRTHNGTAVAGTHYIQKVGAVTFEPKESTKEVPISLLGIDSTWQNADRYFYFDIYRVDGGAIDSSKRMAKCTLSKQAEKEVPKDDIYVDHTLVEYSDKKNISKNSNFEIKDIKFNKIISTDEDYFFDDGNHMGVKIQFQGKKNIFASIPNFRAEDSKGEIIAEIKLNLGSVSETYVNLTYPGEAGTYFNAGKHPPLKLEFADSGAGVDSWSVQNIRVTGKLIDTTGPYTKEVLFNEGNGYTYTSGDMLYVSLKLNEVVEVLTDTPYLKVKLGNDKALDLEYQSGNLTDTLCFGAEVPGGVTGKNITIESLENKNGIRDFSNNEFGAEVSGSSNMDFQSITPTITSSTTGTRPRHLATVGAEMSTGLVLKSLQYAWTESETMPLSGWSEANNKEKLTASPGTGQYYLHLLATADSGINGYTKQSFTFQQMGMQVTGPSDPDTWKQSKMVTLNFSAADGTGAKVVMTLPDGTTNNYETSPQNISVTEAGIYQFVATDALGSRLTQTLRVDKIDYIHPDITITEDDKDKIYSSLNLSVKASDQGGSGLTSLEYAWSKGESVSNGDWKDVPTSGLLEKTGQGSWYLHIRASDRAGNTATAVSGAYTLIDPQTSEDEPQITLEYTAYNEWKKDPVDITYTISQGKSDLVQIALPGGQLANASSTTSVTGNLKAMKNGLYTFVAIDRNGNFATKTAIIDYIDNQPPEISYNYIVDKVTFIHVKATDLVNPRYDSNGQIIAYEGSGIKSLQWTYEEDENYTDIKSGEKIAASVNGTYYIKAVDNVGNEETLEILVNKLINNFSITCDDIEYGDELTPKVNDNSSGVKETIEYKIKDADDKTYTKTAPSALGDYVVRVTIDATGRYQHAVKTKEFSINQREINQDMITLIDNLTYTGSPLTPKPSVTVDAALLVLDKDYTVEYKSNLNVGDAEVSITGIGNYTGNVILSFTIVPKEITFKVDPVESVIYTGDLQTPVITVRDNEFELMLDRDYSVSYTENKNAGQADITIEGKGNYEGSDGSATFVIDKKVLTPSIDLTSAQSKTYDGNVEIAGTPIIALSGAVKDESPTATAYISFANANVGENKLIDAFNINLSDDWNDNYSLSDTKISDAESNLNIKKKDINIEHVAAPSKDYDGTVSAEAGEITFTDLVVEEFLTVGIDYSAVAVFTHNAHAADGIKPYTYTVTMLDTVMANNYNLVSNTKSGKNGTISKIDYKGKKSVSAEVIANQLTIDAKLNLPNLPDGGEYHAIGIVDDSVGLITSNSITNRTLTYSTSRQDLYTEDIITIPVTGTINYYDYSVTATITTRKATDEEKVTYDLNALTVDDIRNANVDEQYITDNLILIDIGSIYGSAITWLSSDTSVIGVDGTVARPESGSADRTVVLTATITNGSEHKEKVFKFTVKKLPLYTGSVSGIVTDSRETPMKNVVIKIQVGDVVVDSTETDGNGFYSFSNMPYGVYSLIAEQNGFTMTNMLSIKSASSEFNVTIPVGNRNTYVEVKGNETPPIAVDNINEMFREEDIEAAQIGEVTIKLVVEAITDPHDGNYIVQNLYDNQLGMYLDIKLLKTITGTSNDGTDMLTQPPSGNKLKIVLEVPEALRGYSDYGIMRVHEGNIAILPAVYDATLHTLTFEADLFSTYAIVYKANRTNQAGSASSASRVEADESNSEGSKNAVASSTYCIEVPEAEKMAKEALDKELNYARSSSDTITVIRKDALLLLAKSDLHYYHDVIVDNAVQMTIYIDKPGNATKDLLVSGHVSGEMVTQRKEQLKELFPNEIAVICMDQQGEFGMQIQVAAKVDLSGLDIDNLYFYSYDRQLETYTRIQTEYEVDTNGFIHFNTMLGGDIIITNAPLDSKQADNEKDASSQETPSTDKDAMPKPAKTEETKVRDSKVESSLVDDLKVEQSDSAAKTISSDTDSNAKVSILSVNSVIGIILLIALFFVVIIFKKKSQKEEDE